MRRITWEDAIGLLAVALMLAMVSFAAKAQTPVLTAPAAGTSTNASSTIALTNTFQQVFASNINRKACLIQNTGTHVMYVFFGTLGLAAQATSFPLYPASAAGYPGGSISCVAGGIVLTDQVSITGTAGDTFTAVSQ
jgi:hypothetical protein